MQKRSVEFSKAKVRLLQILLRLNKLFLVRRNTPTLCRYLSSKHRPKMPSTSKPLFYKCLEKSWLNNRLWSDQKLMILSNLIKILAKQETSKATKVAAKSSLQELVVFSSFSWFVSKVRTYSNNRNSFRLKKAREMFQCRLEAFFFSIVTFHKNEIHGKICMKFSTFDSFGFSPTKCCCVEQFHWRKRLQNRRPTFLC